MGTQSYTLVIERKDYNYEKTTSTNLYFNAFERKS